MSETVNAFTNRLRNEKAARLLRFSQRSIAEIAFECGFSSAATLSRAFKQYFGISPGQYRRGDEIKNSKIRKDLQLITEYYCDIKQEELQQHFPVYIKQLPERKIAYISPVQVTTLPSCKYAFTIVSGDKSFHYTSIHRFRNRRRF